MRELCYTYRDRVGAARCTILRFNVQNPHNFDRDSVIFASITLYLVNRKKLHTELVKISH